MTEPEPRDLRRDQCDDLSSATLRWADNDMLGHLNNAVYLELFDTSINDWMVRETGIDERVAPVQGVVAQSTVRYFAEVSFPGTVEVGDCTYEFAPGSHRTLDVEVEFTAMRVGRQRAHWDGSFEGFVSEVSWARTFGFRRDGAELLSRQRALGVDARVVMVLDD